MQMRACPSDASEASPLRARPTQPVEFSNPNERNLVAEVSTPKTRVYGAGNATRILAYDCGMKYNIIQIRK